MNLEKLFEVLHMLPVAFARGAGGYLSQAVIPTGISIIVGLRPIVDLEI